MKVNVDNILDAMDSIREADLVSDLSDFSCPLNSEIGDLNF